MHTMANFPSSNNNKNTNHKMSHEMNGSADQEADDLSVVLLSHMAEEEKQLPWLVLWPPHAFCVACELTHTHIHIRTNTKNLKGG